MYNNKYFPMMSVNLDAIKNNARVLSDMCGRNGISVAGVIKSSDGDLQIAKAYYEGGCKQIAVSRSKHLKKIKEIYPHIETLLLRSPTRCDMENTAKYADLSLHSDFDVLKCLNTEGEKWGTYPGVILMLDVGDLREGVDNIDELVELAKYCESLPNINLRGVGTSLACLNGILPTKENLSFLIKGAEAVETAIGRKLEIISGGSSINLFLLRDGINQMPERINHLRIGGVISNPIAIRLNRNWTYNGLREDTIKLEAEIIEVHEKSSAPKGVSTKNWAGATVKQEDKGRRVRAILALGSQDISDAKTMIPIDENVEIIGGSSDHTIVDVTDSERKWKSGDIMSFKIRYSNMLYAFSGDHVTIEYTHD